MADSKPWLKQIGWTKMLLLVLVLGSLWLGSILSEGNAGGQTPQGQLPVAPPLPPPATTTAQSPQPVFVNPQPPPTPVMALTAVRREQFHFTFKADMPLKDLLPIPPKTKMRTAQVLVEDLTQVPEVSFQEYLTKSPEALKLTAHTMAKINHLNRKKTDGFMEALLGERTDLTGLPIAMGDACRMKGDRSQFFSQALAIIKKAKGQGADGRAETELRDMQAIKQAILVREKAQGSTTVVGGPQSVPAPVAQVQQNLTFDNIQLFTNGSIGVQKAVDPEAFWDKFGQLCAQDDKANNKLDPCQLEQVTLARIAALMQVLAPDSVAMRRGLVKYLAGTSHAEATRALAKLAIFSAEDEVRNPAIEALKVRRDKDYTAVLFLGLRYPLPAVAKRATEAMVKLERADLVPELVNFLQERDPRAPTIQEVGQRKIPVARELVRINHHRNCVLCHAPAVPGEVPSQVTTAEVPRPDQPLSSPSEGYSNSIPEILVRLDVTYLRQDFSLLQPVADALPWPEMQRFDFLVRTRTLTDKEAAAFPTPKAGDLTPYQRATLAALRELTGRDTAPTHEAWRKLLDLPERQTRESLE